MESGSALGRGLPRRGRLRRDEGCARREFWSEPIVKV